MLLYAHAYSASLVFKQQHAHGVQKVARAFLAACIIFSFGKYHQGLGFVSHAKHIPGTMFYVQSTGVDHLLYSGRGAGGTRKGGEAAELHVACYMGLVSFFAGRLDVLRVASKHAYGPLNAEARANVQSATITDTPLTDAGLDGTGQVIQVQLLLPLRTPGAMPKLLVFPTSSSTVSSVGHPSSCRPDDEDRFRHNYDGS